MTLESTLSVEPGWNHAYSIHVVKNQKPRYTNENGDTITPIQHENRIELDSIEGIEANTLNSMMMEGRDKFVQQELKTSLLTEAHLPPKLYVTATPLVISEHAGKTIVKEQISAVWSSLELTWSQK